MNDKFYFFASCMIVKGAAQSVVYDLQRKSYEYIPNVLYDILIEYNGKTIQNIVDDYGEENKEVIVEYFEYLSQNEFIFFSNFGEESFPKIDLTWHSPFQISTLIIDISTKTFPSLKKIYNEVEALGCGAISFRFLDVETYVLHFEEAMRIFGKSRCRSFELFLPFDASKNVEYFNQLTIKNNRIYSIHIYDANERKVEILDEIKTPLFYHSETLEANSPHVSNSSNFLVNKDMFMESQHHNTFFNRKIYINEAGEIKNAPNCEEVFGQVDQDALESILKEEGFQKYWNINKDTIAVCKDCEHRYMCMSDRKPLKKVNELWQLEGKCAYNPYEAEWA
ncbi:grasp-with-spasm system SPASM domain peptide maturase [Kordia sp.]|uniref:grasp-with-spasm system SPASM domain peptide maturase n=1 Tax=Kordia sp. TaxID=1965332 RepID=UPI003D6A0FD6